MLKSTTPATFPDLDWYNAETSKGDPSDGVARALVNQQHADGSWYGSPPYAPTGEYYNFQTAWAIIMLNRTIFQAGAPVAVAQAIPNPGVAGQIITLDGSESYHQDPSKTIVSWAWDIGNDGTTDATGPVTTYSWPAVGNYPVKLTVTDNAASPATASTIVTVIISTPPLAPTADAGGPYNFCPNRTPWFLDGTGSVNPDEGQHQPGSFPGDTIYGPNQFAWDLDGNGTFIDAYGQTPDVTAFFTGKGVGSYLVQLKVTDTTAASFPSSGIDLSSTDSAQVVVRAGNDPACSCGNDLTARPKLNKAELRWTWKPGAHHYNVYRGTISGGPYLRSLRYQQGQVFIWIWAP